MKAKNETYHLYSLAIKVLVYTSKKIKSKKSLYCKCFYNISFFIYKRINFFFLERSFVVDVCQNVIVSVFDVEVSRKILLTSFIDEQDSFSLVIEINTTMLEIKL